MKIRKLSTRAADFNVELAQLLAFESTADEVLETTVAKILADVRRRGDACDRLSRETIAGFVELYR